MNTQLQQRSEPTTQWRKDNPHNGSKLLEGSSIVMNDVWFSNTVRQMSKDGIDFTGAEETLGDTFMIKSKTKSGQRSRSHTRVVSG